MVKESHLNQNLWQLFMCPALFKPVFLIEVIDTKLLVAMSQSTWLKLSVLLLYISKFYIYDNAREEDDKLSLNNTACFHLSIHIAMYRNIKNIKRTLKEEIESWILLLLLVTYFLKAFLYMVMPYFSCCIPRRSNKMRQDPYKMVKKQHKCFMIFHHGIDSISTDIPVSMHRIEIIEIENNLSIYRIEKKF